MFDQARDSGGWVMTMAMSAPGDDLLAALGRLRNAMWGGDRVTSEDLQKRLVASGFSEVKELPFPAIATKIVAARKAP